MLSSLLAQLQTYFNKYFVVGSFSPMLAFTFINGAAAYFIVDYWREWADENILKATATGGTFLVTSLVIAIVLAAYVLSSLSTFLRRQLEGKWWDVVAAWFIPAQNRRRLALLGELDATYREMTDLDHIDEWEDRLLSARIAGSRDHANTQFAVQAYDPVEDSLDTLEQKRRAHADIKVADLIGVATRLRTRLRNYDVDRSERLEQQHRRLSALIDYAGDFFAEGARGRHVRLQNELNSNFGAQDMAPTRMGNIANTIQSYVMRRYRCNLEVLWSNLTQIAMKDEKGQAMLMEAKTQLDFLVACCWLTLLTAAIWSVVTYAIVPSRWGFMLSALGGPLAAYLWYRAAAEQYRSFADVAMTAFDTFRFQLLSSMRLQMPADVEQERFMWEAVDKLSTFGDEQNFRYEKAEAQSAPAH